VYKIQDIEQNSTLGLELFPRENYEIASEIMKPDGANRAQLDMHEMPMPESLKVIARAAARA